MLRHNIDDHSHEEDEVEHSRRSFFGRLAIGAALSIAMPGVAHAAKKSDKNHRPTQPSRTAVRLPKHAPASTSKAGQRNDKFAANRSGGKYQKASTNKTGKSAHREKGRLIHATQTEHSTHQNARVRDVYSGKHPAASPHHSKSHSHHGGRVHSVIQSAQNDLILERPREPMFLVDRGRMTTHRSLAFQNPHTGDKLTLTYFEKGRYLNDALNEISFLLRDHRTDDVHPIDPELLDQLHDLKQMLGLNQPFDVICGYRSPLTNAKLHAEHSGVANNSFHMYGRAVDIRIERFDLRRIHNAAVAMHRGGVGYYPESNFIHLDTGTFRTWSL